MNYNDFNQLDNSWIKYEGNFFKNKRHGSGVLILASGEKFTGTWNHGVI